MHVALVQSLADLGALAGPWRSLLRHCPRRHLFIAPEFAQVWWEQFGAGKALYVLAAWEGPRLVGVAPMMVAPARYGGLPVRMLGGLSNRHVSRTEWVIPAERQRVIDAFSAYLAAHAHDWDVLKLVHVPRESELLPALTRGLEAAGFRSFPTEVTRDLAYLPLQGTWDSYTQAQSKSFRDNLRLYRNRLKKAGGHVVRENRPAQIQASMARFFALEQRSWKTADADMQFSDTDRRFYVRLAEAFAASGEGQYTNWFCQVGDCDVGAFHGMEYDGTLFFFLNLFDRTQGQLSPERQLAQHVIEEFYASGEVTRIDFNGDSRFIGTWATATLAHEAISACHWRPYSRVLSGLKRIKRLARAGGGARGC